MSKKCLECGEPYHGRTDKKFCADFCRNAYNNRIKASASEYYRKVNSSLRRNYKILAELLTDDTADVTETILQQKGFNFRYYTNVYTTQKGSNYYFCYEYGYLPLGQENYFLVKRKEVAVR